MIIVIVETGKPLPVLPTNLADEVMIVHTDDMPELPDDTTLLYVNALEPDDNLIVGEPEAPKHTKLSHPMKTPVRVITQLRVHNLLRAPPALLHL